MKVLTLSIPQVARRPTWPSRWLHSGEQCVIFNLPHQSIWISAREGKKLRGSTLKWEEGTEGPRGEARAHPVHHTTHGLRCEPWSQSELEAETQTTHQVRTREADRRAAQIRGAMAPSSPDLCHPMTTKLKFTETALQRVLHFPQRAAAATLAGSHLKGLGVPVPCRRQSCLRPSPSWAGSQRR